MAIYRNVQLSFWSDNKVADDFTPEDKYFYLYLLTNPQSNICGCYEVSFSQMVNQTGYNKETIIRLIDRFEKQHKVIRYDKGTKELLILNWYKYNWNKSEKVLAGVENVAKYIKSDELKKYVFSVTETIRNDTPCIPYIYPMQTSVSDTVSDTITDTDTVVKKSYKDKVLDLILQYNISDYLQECLMDWIEYKKERSFRYKDVGLKNLVKTVSKNSKQYGDEAVAEVIQESISNGYQGIVWDKIGKQPKSRGERDIVSEWRNA